MKKLIALTLFLSFSAVAENFRVGPVDKSMRIAQERVDHLDAIEVLDDGKSVFKYSADLVTQRLLQYGLVKFKNKEKPFLVTVWTSGAHGQELIIFDPAKGNGKDGIAYLYGSAWTIDLDINQERIEIKGKGEVDEKSDEPVPQNLTFRP